MPMKGTLQTTSIVMNGIDRKAQPVTNVTRRTPSEELVTPSSTATVETLYTIGGKFYAYGSSGWSDYTAGMNTIQVAIDGEDMYIQGLAYWFKEAWIKGKIGENNMVLFDNGQLIGEDNDGAEYIVGSNDGTTLSDGILFNYYPDYGILECVTDYIIESGAADAISPYCYWTKPTFSKEEPVAPEVVVVPDGLVAEEYSLSYTDYYGKPASGAVKIGFDNTDVYIQGFCSYLPEAWIKGTLDGTTITFAGDQYFGNYAERYDMFLQEQDVVFTYDADANTLTAEDLVYTYTGNNYVDYYVGPVMTKVVEVAATPATPTISSVAEGNYGWSMKFSIPTVDTEGNGILTAKLSYQLFTDVEQEINPLVFTPATHTRLTEDMTIFPYGFTEGYDFYDTQIYFNDLFSEDWNKIGIQSIYTGGGEEHKSEIFWYTIKDYTKVAIDFNAMDVATSSTESTAGDITEPTNFEAGVVTLTVSPSTTATANRLWGTNNGPQLRMYSGTMTFTVPATKVISEITFNASKWNDGNTADCGTLNGKVWTGSENKVIFTIAANTQINSIIIKTDDFVPTPVEVPEGLETEIYTFSAKAIEAGKEEEGAQDYSFLSEVGFDGDNIYIKGLSTDTSDMWMKATKNAEGKYVIPANQYLGQLSFFGMYIFDYFIAAVDEAGNAVDVVLDYDAANNKFTTSQTVVLNSSLTEWDPYQTFTEVAFTKFAEVAATPADPTLEAINFTGVNYPNIYCSIPTEGTNNEILNTNKLFYTVWIEKNGQQTPYTFTTTLYPQDFDEDVVEVPYKHDGYDLYAGGEIIYFEESEEELTSWSKVGIQSIYYGAGECRKSNIVWLENGSADGISDIKADMHNGNAVIYNLAGQRIANGQKPTAKGLYIINGKKVMVK